MQLSCDITCRLAFASQAQHLTFTIIERIVAGPCFQGQLRINRTATAMDFADCLGKLFGWRILEQIATDTGIQRPAQESRACERGQNHDLAFQIAFVDTLRQFKPGHSRHLDIGQHDIWTIAPDLLPGFFAIGRIADNINIRFKLKQRGQGTAHHRLIFS